MEDERRCEEVAQLLLEGKKGEELADALRKLDRVRSQTPVNQPGFLYTHRRSSSVPLPNDYYGPYGHVTIPPPPFLAARPASPMARQQRLTYGQQRRPSSAGPAFFRSSWGQNQLINTAFLNNDPSPLPEPDPTLYNSFSNFNFQTSPPDDQPPPYNVSELMATLPPHEQSHDSQLSLGPLEPLAPQDILARMYTNNSTPPGSNNNATETSDLDMTGWLSSSLQQSPGLPSSHTSTSSGSPQPFDGMLPLPVFAPQPMHPDQTPTSAMFCNAETIVTGDWSGHAMDFQEHSLGYQPEDGNCVDGTKFPFSSPFDFGEYVKNEV
jgi:transcription factor SOX7/8/10/18 (SOX group E/F)